MVGNILTILCKDRGFSIYYPLALFVFIATYATLESGRHIVEIDLFLLHKHILNGVTGFAVQLLVREIALPKHLDRISRCILLTPNEAVDYLIFGNIEAT